MRNLDNTPALPGPMDIDSDTDLEDEKEYKSTLQPSDELLTAIATMIPKNTNDALRPIVQSIDNINKRIDKLVKPTPQATNPPGQRSKRQQPQRQQPHPGQHNLPPTPRLIHHARPVTPACILNNEHRNPRAGEPLQNVVLAGSPVPWASTDQQQATTTRSLYVWRREMIKFILEEYAAASDEKRLDRSLEITHSRISALTLLGVNQDNKETHRRLDTVEEKMYDISDHINDRFDTVLAKLNDLHGGNEMLRAAYDSTQAETAALKAAVDALTKRIDEQQEVISAPPSPNLTASLSDGRDDYATSPLPLLAITFTEATLEPQPDSSSVQDRSLPDAPGTAPAETDGWKTVEAKATQKKKTKAKETTSTAAIPKQTPTTKNGGRGKNTHRPSQTTSSTKKTWAEVVNSGGISGER
ncbi:hypothetical protein BZA77DRAFT_350395 [Pyronema omphalodes]|nr:hypothetical protein BZA77DRAFT_350395 [Pyronema omphalodes]